MSCWDEGIAYYAACAGTGIAIAAAIAEAGSVVGSPALVPTIAAAVVAGVAAVAAGMSFAECLENSGKADEAERMRRDVEELRDEIDRLKELAGVS